MATCNYNCIALPNHLQIDCGEYRKGGNSAIGILDCDHTITDFTSASQTQDAIDNGLLTIIRGVKAMIPEATPVESPNPIGCGSETIVTGYDRTVTWTDSNVSDDNITFYNALNKRSNYLIVYNCNDDPDDDGEITVIETGASFNSRRLNPESSRELQSFLVTASFSKFDMSPIFSAPAGIYEV